MYVLCMYVGLYVLLSVCICCVCIHVYSFFSVVIAFCRVRGNAKKETKTNLYMRWEQDNDLAVAGDLGLFEEYLEMGEFTAPMYRPTYMYT